MSSQWYYKRDGQRFGPLTSRKIRRMAWRGDLLPTDLLWKEGMTGWRPAGDSHRLFRGTDADPAARPRRRRTRRRERRNAAAPPPRSDARSAAVTRSSLEWIAGRPLLSAIVIGVVGGIFVSAILAAVIVGPAMLAPDPSAGPLPLPPQGAVVPMAAPPRPPEQPAPEQRPPEPPTPEPPAGLADTGPAPGDAIFRPESADGDEDAPPTAEPLPAAIANTLDEEDAATPQFRAQRAPRGRRPGDDF